MGEIENIRKKIEKEREGLMDIDEDSDIPISEKKTREKNIRT